MLYSRGRHHRPLRTPNPNIGVGANLSERVGVNLAECPGAYSPEWWAPSRRNRHARRRLRGSRRLSPLAVACGEAPPAHPEFYAGPLPC